MKVIILALAILYVCSAPAWGGERTLKCPLYQKELERYDELTALALKGIGEGREMSRDDCEVEIHYTRHHLIKSYSDYETLNPKTGCDKAMASIISSGVRIPCRAKK